MRMEKKKKAGSLSMVEENKPEYQLDMKEIIQRAEIRKWGKAKEKVNLQHLSPERNRKQAMDKINEYKKHSLNLFKEPLWKVI